MNRKQILAALAMDAGSPEALELRQTADALSRSRFHGKSLLLGQIGVESHPCPGKCDFCTFSQDHFAAVEQTLDVKTVSEQAVKFAGDGELDALFLMAMHDYNPDNLLELVHSIRGLIPEQTKLVLNIGDCPLDLWRKFKSAGVSGAYHVLRLREGRDTALNPISRRATIAAIREAGLNWYYCCEPIGSEHTNEEIADAIEVGNEFGCYQHAAMARVNFPGSTMAPEISRERLAQIVAVVTLASEDNRELKSVAVHEPDALSLRSGANSIYAEAGANPRDTAGDTAAGRGRSVQASRAMLTEAGWK